MKPNVWERIEKLMRKIECRRELEKERKSKNTKAA